MKKVIFVLLLGMVLLGVLFLKTGEEYGKIKKNNGFSDSVSSLIQEKVATFKSDGCDILLEGRSLAAFDYRIRIDDDMNIYASERFLEDIMGCSVNQYKTGNVKIERAKLSLEYGRENLIEDDGEIFIPVSDNLKQLGYSATYSFRNNSIDFKNLDNGNYLPDAYDMRSAERVSPVRDQGKFGTCWAFASLGALETTTLPLEENIYSVDHMSLNNGFNLDLSQGGEHNMSIAYMAAWRGPVYEKDDPYGDGVTSDKLKAVKHLEEAIVIDSKNLDKVKSAVFKYGGVETSIFLEMSYGSSDSDYYNKDTNSYCYMGMEKPNHDIVIVGWNDHYPKENFKHRPTADGAFICKNSWGTKFGEDGFFYVSYQDSNICNESIVYTRLVDPDNYDNIYQSDILGWVGQMGFSAESAYFANVYTAKKDEVLRAVSFYATGDNTTFKVFVVNDFKDVKSLNGGRTEVGNGETRYSGYYTVDLKQEIELKKGQRFAVIVSIDTPGSEKPIAIECDAGERTASIDLTDGEGYMSLYGEKWHSAEESNANICLKAFTDDVKGE